MFEKKKNQKATILLLNMSLFKNLTILSMFWSLSIALCCYQEHNKTSGQ